MGGYTDKKVNTPEPRGERVAAFGMGPHAAKGRSFVNKPQSPPGGKRSNGSARSAAALGLTLLVFCGFCLSKVGGKAFDLGIRLERWARRRRDGQR
jgi:hypothetical protein